MRNTRIVAIAIALVMSGLLGACNNSAPRHEGHGFNVHEGHSDEGYGGGGGEGGEGGAGGAGGHGGSGGHGH